MEKKHYQVVVVGAGLSGLTSAVYLARAGYSVLVLEKSDRWGGVLGSFEKEGFTFDAGARSIENAGVIRPMLRELDIDLELLESPVSLFIEQNGIHMNSGEGLGDYRRMLEALFPRSLDSIERIFRVIDRVMKEMAVIYGFDNPLFRDFKNDRNYLFRELLPWFPRFLLAVRRMGRMNAPIEDFLAGISNDSSLNDMVDQHFFKQIPMFFALGYFYVYRDYLYPKGGTGRLPEKMGEKFLSLGGEIRFRTEVSRFLPVEKTLLTSDGFSCSWDSLVWCADQKALYRCCDPSGLRPSVARKVEKNRRAVEACRGGDSVFSLFLGVDRPVEDFAAVTNGHFFYTPSRQGLGNLHREELAALIRSPASGRQEITSWLERYQRLTTYEISIPSLRDPSLSPPGKTGLVISYLLEYDLVKKVETQGWYEEFKQKVEEGMVKVFDQSLFPGIEGRITTRVSASPCSIERRFGCSGGAITGWSFEKESPAVDRLLQILRAVKTPFPSVFQAGQWTYSPAGIPTAILTGKYAADAVLSY